MRTNVEAENRDLGFGSLGARESSRLLDQNGGFAIARTGLGWREVLSLNHTLLTMTWPRFLGLTAAGYLGRGARCTA